MNKNKLAVIDGGLYYHYFSINDGVAKDFINSVHYLRDLKFDDIADSDSLLVLSSQNTDLLEEKKDIFLEYANIPNKHLTIFGRNRTQNWIPNLKFTDTPTNFWWWLEENPNSGLSAHNMEHQIFKYLSLQDATWHYHGMFDVPEGATNFVSCREGGSLLYEDKNAFPATLLISSLDPDYHHGSFFMPATTKFWHKILNYLANKD